MELYSVSLAVYYPKKQQVNSAEPAWAPLTFSHNPNPTGGTKPEELALTTTSGLPLSLLFPKLFLGLL